MRIEQMDTASVDTVVRLFARVVEGMRAAGIDQWDEIYPDPAVLSADLRAGEAFGLFDESGGPAPVGYVTLNADQPEEYGAIPWFDRAGSPLVIHRLCVDPAFRGRGAAKGLMAFAEGFAAQGGYTSIRLDAFSLNPPALALYAGLGYSLRGQVRFRKGRFHCYEKTFGRNIRLFVDPSPGAGF